jgi:hypothetical protein
MIPACLRQLTLEVLAFRLIHLVCHTVPAFANVPEITKQSSSRGGISASVLLAAFFLFMSSSPAIGSRETLIIGLGFAALAFIRLHPDSATHPHDIAHVTGSIAFHEVKLSPQPELSLLPIAFRKLFPSGLRKPSHLEIPPQGATTATVKFRRQDSNLLEYGVSIAAFSPSLTFACDRIL